MMNLQQAMDFLKYRLKAKNRHGIHSPFVYRLLDKVIYDFRAKSVYHDIEKLRAELLEDEREILLTDRDGKSINKDKRIKIKSCAGNLRSASVLQLIYRLVEDLKPRHIIESGNSLGISTAYLAKAAPQAKIIHIEDNRETVSITAETLRKLNIQNVELKSGDFTDLFPGLLRDFSEPDIVIIEGVKRKDHVLNYFNGCLPALSSNSMMVFGNIYQNNEMKEAWSEIKSHPEVTVTLDLFQIGLVFVRRAQAKEDFTIRF